jgi:hypothetical protein
MPVELKSSNPLVGSRLGPAPAYPLSASVVVAQGHKGRCHCMACNRPGDAFALDRQCVRTPWSSRSGRYVRLVVAGSRTRFELSRGARSSVARPRAQPLIDQGQSAARRASVRNRRTIIASPRRGMPIGPTSLKQGGRSCRATHAPNSCQGCAHDETRAPPPTPLGRPAPLREVLQRRQ